MAVAGVVVVVMVAVAPILLGILTTMLFAAVTKYDDGVMVMKDERSPTAAHDKDRTSDAASAVGSANANVAVGNESDSTSRVGCRLIKRSSREVPSLSSVALVVVVNGANGNEDNARAADA